MALCDQLFQIWCYIYIIFFPDFFYKFTLSRGEALKKGSNVAGDPYLDFGPKSSPFQKFLIHMEI